jgi:urease accessory protein
MHPSSTALLRLLQLTNSALPVGAYSYSEGLETLCQQGAIASATDLQHWLSQELQQGAIAIETAIMVRCWQAHQQQDWPALIAWNDWFIANRETEELRSQSLQMGRSLLRLLRDLGTTDSIPRELMESACTFPCAFGIGASGWGIGISEAVLGYGQSWVTNGVSAGVKLIPLGQTQGQATILALNALITAMSDRALSQTDDVLEGCSWGLQLASMAHESLYSRLFRS